MIFKSLFYDWFGLNNAWLLAVNHGTPAWLIPMARLGNLLGDYRGAPVALLFLLGCGALYQRNRLMAAHWFLQARRFILACLIAAPLLALLKHSFGLPRPYMVFTEPLTLIGHPDSLFSFPSGHAVYAALLAAVLWPLFQRPYQCWLLFFPVWVCWSRMASGMHFPADVVAGSVLGWACARCACWLAIASPQLDKHDVHKAYQVKLASMRGALKQHDLTAANAALRHASIIGQTILLLDFHAHLWALRLSIKDQNWREILQQIIRLGLIPIRHLTGRLPIEQRHEMI